MEINRYNTNIYPNDIEKHYIKSSERSIISSLKIKAENTCRNLINPDYIHKAFNRFKSGYYYTSIQNEVLGFVLWKEINIVQENKSILQKETKHIKQLHIILVCADINDFRLGTKILFDVESYCITHKIPIITLEAANEKLIQYYEQNNFKRVDTLTNRMIKEIKIIDIYRNPANKTRKVKRYHNSHTTLISS